MNKEERERHLSGYSGKDSLRDNAKRMFGAELTGRGVREGFPASFSAPGREKARLYKKGGAVAHEMPDYQTNLRLPRRVPTPRLDQQDLHTAQVMKRGGHAKRHYADGGLLGKLGGVGDSVRGQLGDHINTLLGRLGPFGGVIRTVKDSLGFERGGYVKRGHRGYRRHRAEGGELEGTQTSTMTSEHPDMPHMEEKRADMPEAHHEPEPHHEEAYHIPDAPPPPPIKKAKKIEPEIHHEEEAYHIPDAPPPPPEKKMKIKKSLLGSPVEASIASPAKGQMFQRHHEGRRGRAMGAGRGMALVGRARRYKDGGPAQHYDFGGIVKGIGNVALHLLPSLIPMLMKKEGGQVNMQHLHRQLESALTTEKRRGGHLRQGHKGHHYAKGGSVYESMMVGEPGHSKRAPRNNWESVMRGEHAQRSPEGRKSARHPGEDMSHGTVFKRGGRMAAGGVAKIRHDVANKRGRPMHAAHIQRTPNLFD
jgi:hypothetical protein